MPKNPQLAKDWKNSKIRNLCTNWKNFVGSAVQFAYDKKSKLYSAKAQLDGNPYIISIRVGDAVEILLMDRKGNIVEHAINDGSKIVFTKK